MFRESLMCYISTMNNKIYLVDMMKNNIIKSIELPFNPFSLTLTMDKKSIYVGSNKNGIALISTKDNDVAIKDIENNGNIAIDYINKKIYISDISQVSVYDIKNYKKLSEIKGFRIIDNLILDKELKRLFCVDLFTKQLKIYETTTLKSISIINNIGIKPSHIIVDDKKNKCYIGNRGGIDKTSGNVSIIDLESNEVEFIDFPEGSSIDSVVLVDKFLYTCNLGLKRIDVIDLTLNKIVDYISKKDFNPKDICLSPEKNTIIVINELLDETIELCEIDCIENKISNIVELNKDIKKPLDVLFINNDNKEKSEDTEEKSQVYNKEVEENISDNETKIDIELRKVLIKHTEKIDSQNLIIDIPKDYVDKFALENIKFSKGFIVNGTEEISCVENEKNLYRINFLLKIPYIIKMKNEKNKSVIMKKTIEKYMGIMLDIPTYSGEKPMELDIKTKTIITDNPVIIKEILNFSIETEIELKVLETIELNVPLSIINKYYINKT